MKAARVHAYGPPEVIAFEDVPMPEPAVGEVLVRVDAAGVGPWDAWIRAGKSVLPQPLPLTLGADLAGTIAAVGDDESDFAVGDEVYGVTNARFIGAYAEYALASARMLARKPTRLDFVESASVPVVAVTAWQLLEQAQVAPGQTILVHGAAGNVGSFAVQFARLQGTRIVATAFSQDVAYVGALGADEVIDPESADFASVTSGIDAVIDTVGGDVQDRSFAVIKRGGFLISAVSRPDERAAERHGVRSNFMLVDVTRVYLKRIAEMIDAGKIRASVGTVLPLSHAREAHELLESRNPRPRGKIVLNTTATSV